MGGPSILDGEVSMRRILPVLFLLFLLLPSAAQAAGGPCAPDVVGPDGVVHDLAWLHGCCRDAKLSEGLKT